MIWKTLPRSKLSKQLNGWRGGSGPHLLMIHGVGMHADYWSNLIPRLENYFSLTVIDMPGHGSSLCSNAKTPSLAHYTDRIAQLIQNSSAPSLVVGHSMGAMIALDLATRYADCISAFVALNAVFQRSDTAKTEVRSRAKSIAEGTDMNISSTLERWFEKPSEGVPAIALTECEKWLNRVNRKGYQQAYHAFAHHDEPDADTLKRIQCAGLFMTGENEPNSTPAMSRAMASALEHGEYYIAKGARHMMSMTHGDEVLDKLVPFLLQHTATATHE